MPVPDPVTVTVTVAEVVTVTSQWQWSLRVVLNRGVDGEAAMALDLFDEVRAMTWRLLHPKASDLRPVATPPAPQSWRRAILDNVSRAGDRGRAFDWG
jgi:hypothetical protein